MIKLNLIEFTDYDGKDYILIEGENNEFTTVQLNIEEKLALANMNIAKLQLSYMCRYDTPNGGVTYELAKDKKGSHDDHAYTVAEAGYALAKLRRADLLLDKSPKQSYTHAPTFATAINF